MTLLQLLVLALIQGLTEFLPVSSSAHLILGSRAFGWPDQGLAFDVATHLGTLLAVLWYFRRDLAAMGSAVLSARHGDAQSRRLAWLLVLASIPALVVGALAADWVEAGLRSPVVIAVATILFGIVLWLADRYGARRWEVSDIGLRPALLIGLAQVLALIPGTSRSGITITAGRALGLKAPAAARFSFLLSIPIIAAAGGHGLLRVLQGDAGIALQPFLLAAAISALTALACIHVFLQLLERIGLTPFVIYRLLLGTVLLWLVL